MTEETFNITIHMVQSLDGFIAKKDNSVDWFNSSSIYEKGTELTGEQIQSFLQSIDCYVMGANTYRHALALSEKYGWAYGATPLIVTSHQTLPLYHANVTLYASDLQQLVKEQLIPYYKNIWVAGGAILAREFIRRQLATELRLSILPVLLGDGITLFDDSVNSQSLQLKDVATYKNGMVELKYVLSR